MAKSDHNTVDFNSVLMGLNLIVAGLVGSAYSLAQSNAYIDQNTILLGLLLSLQTHLALQVERVRRDPFVILLAFITILYFSFRLYTLALFAYSSVFLRYPYDAHDSNFALVFILIANVFLYAGLFCARSRRDAVAESRDWRPTSAGRVVVLMTISLAYFYLSSIFSTRDEQPKAVLLLGVFITPEIIFLMALSYLVLFRNTLNKKTTIAIVVLIVLEIVAHTLSGSRSGIVTLIQNVLLSLLAISGCIKFRRSHFILGCALMPVLLALLVASFTISTFNRITKRGESFDVARSIEQAGYVITGLEQDVDWDVVLPPIFDRAGYFDFSAEIIAHADLYKEVINLPAYARSIVDNLLTPGFDIYDQPKLSTALHFVYLDWGVPSKEMILSEQAYYHSDQFGLYGELYVLFGYASLPLFFLTAFGLKRIYVRLQSDNPFTLAMKRVIVLSVFVETINSYGFDWTIVEIVPFVVAIYLYSYCFRSRRSPVLRELPALNGA